MGRSASMLPKTVLVVEDDRTFQWLLHRELTEKGFHVYCCSDCRTAISISAGRPFDVFIIDCGVFCGKVGAYVRSLRERYPAALIIGMSGYADGSDFTGNGADHFLEKPFEFEQFLGLLNAQ